MSGEDFDAYERRIWQRFDDAVHGARKRKVKCNECVFATGYIPMYVGGDCRKWGTSICTRLKRRRRVDTLGGYDGCNKGVRKENAK